MDKSRANEFGRAYEEKEGDKPALPPPDAAATPAIEAKKER